MNYAILLKTVVDANSKTNSVEKVPMMEVFPTISLESMYKLCECELVDIKDMPLQLVEFDGELGIIPAVTLVFDEEFLLKNEKPVANELASVIYGYGRLHDQCLCGNVLLCYTNEEGECMPFSEGEANAIVKCLTRINNHIGDMEFKVQKPMMKFMTF